jgi:hypothetical protein
MVKNEDADEWEVVEFPAILNDEPLWPEFWPIEELLAKKAIEEVGIKAQVAQFGSIFVTYFTDAPISNYRDLALNNDDARFIAYRKHMIEQGIFKIPFRLKKKPHLCESH